jgi:ribosomal protein S18 acetylase RimI-like enzyme
MAALSELRAPEVVDLRDLRAEDLNPLLEEESLTWRSQFSWDSSASAELVRRFVRIQALNGFALLLHGRVIGYSYYVCEERKALIGDLYLLREFATTENEDHLLAAVLQALMKTPYMHRVEAQLLLMHGPYDRPMPFSRYLRTQSRIFMMLDLEDANKLPEAPAASRYLFHSWNENRQEEAAKLIARSYEGHIDGSINDQYRSVSGARRFLMNIVQYPGCGAFFPPGSFLADSVPRRLEGLSLTSLVAQHVGHITQICVSPEARQRGVGYELMRRSLRAFAECECEKASLTVTTANEGAVQLYQRMGFRATRRFGAYVWEGF